MKNFIHEKPTTSLHGRLLKSATFLEEIDIKEKKILDLGCGYGWCTLYLLSQGAMRVDAIEQTEKDILTAKEAILDTRAVFHVSSALRLPFQEQTFDTVVCWEVLEHIPRKTELLMYKEIFRVLKPGGALYLSTPHNNTLANIFDPAWWIAGHRHYSTQKLINFAKKAGFRIQKIDKAGRAWSIIETLNMYVAKWIFHRKPFFSAYFNQRIDKEYAKHGYVNVFIKHTKKYPYTQNNKK